MCQWLPLYELSADNIRSVIATFADNFVHTTVWQTAYDAVLIGSNQPLVLPEDLAERLRVPTVARQLAAAGIDDPLSLVFELTLDEAGVERVSTGARRNTDDNLYLEFSSPLSVGTPEVANNILMFNPQRAEPARTFPGIAGWVPPGRAPADVLADYRRAKSATVEEQVVMQRALGAGAPEPFVPIIDRLAPVVESVPDYGRPVSLLCLAWTRHGLSLLATGQDQPGIDALARAVETMPGNAEANSQLATALADRGRADRSLEFFERALTNRPGDARARAHYGAALLQLGRLDEARTELTAAMAQRPHDAGPYHHLAILDLRAGNLGESEANFREALRLDPSRPGVHNSFAVLLTQVRRWSEAVDVLEVGLALHANDGHMARQLAWLLATAPDAELRDGTRAVALARRVNDQTAGQVPQILDTLAAALAETGRFDDAATMADNAATLAEQQGQADLAQQARARAELYRQRQPFHLP